MKIKIEAAPTRVSEGGILPGQMFLYDDYVYLCINALEDPSSDPRQALKCFVNLSNNTVYSSLDQGDALVLLVEGTLSVKKPTT